MLSSGPSADSGYLWSTSLSMQRSRLDMERGCLHTCRREAASDCNLAAVVAALVAPVITALVAALVAALIAALVAALARRGVAIRRARELVRKDSIASRDATRLESDSFFDTASRNGSETSFALRNADDILRLQERRSAAVLRCSVW